MRIGTWNLAGRWSPAHRQLLEDAGCDVWLLTEVPAALSLGEGDLVRSQAMPGLARRSWAAIWSAEPLIEAAPVHEAAAFAHREGMLLCSCVLPWRSAAASWPDKASNTAGRTVAALARLAPAFATAPGRTIWGGDWNHAMNGRETAGSAGGRRAILDRIEEDGFYVATADQPHAIDGLLSIDHIAVPRSATMSSCRRIVAEADGKRLSDHDAYLVEVSSLMTADGTGR